VKDTKSRSWYWEQITPLCADLHFSEMPEEFLIKFQRLRPEVGHLFAASWCHGEVCNGGFHQFFSNSTGVLAPEALEAFRAMGQTELAGVLEEAIAFFPTPYPRVRDNRQDFLRENIKQEQYSTREECDPFSRLDDRFYRTKPKSWESVANEYAERILP
jgi:hypothetical protein